MWWQPQTSLTQKSPIESKGQDPGFQETWHLRATDCAGTQSLHLRFHLIRSRNGFQRNCEVWATLLRRIPGSQDVQRQSLKQVFDLGEFTCSEPQSENEAAEFPLLRFGSAQLNPSSSRGTIQSKGRKLTWNLHWKPLLDPALEFNRVPAGLQNSFQAATLTPQLEVSGSLDLDGTTWTFERAPGLREHHGGGGLPESWAWAHAWLQRADSPTPTPLPIEGYLEASFLRSKLIGPLRTPALNAFRIHYRGEDYRFNTLWESLRAKSVLKRHQWTFQVERDDLRFAGKFTAELKDFAGLCFEDTDGTLAYAIETGLARFELVVYRRGKLETRFHAPTGAQFEIVTRKPDPYVALLG